MNQTVRVLEETLLARTRRILVAGDIHGDARTLSRLLRHFAPDEDILVLLGDYADRGGQGVEVVERIDQLLRAYPERVVAIQGNHEVYSAAGEPDFSPCDLRDEAEEKWGSWSLFFETVFRPFLTRLHLYAVIPQRLLFLHGGISTRVLEANDLMDLTAEQRIDILCSDCTLRFAGERNNSMRGKGVRFGPDVTTVACRKFGVERIYRGHQHDLARKGPSVLHDGKMVTLVTSSLFSHHPYVLALDPVLPSQSAQILWLNSGEWEGLDFEEQERESMRWSVMTVSKRCLAPIESSAVDAMLQRIGRGESRSWRDATIPWLSLPAPDETRRYVSRRMEELGSTGGSDKVLLAYVDVVHQRVIDLYLGDRSLSACNLRRITS